MHSKRLLRWLLVVLIAVAALGMAIPAALAQGDDPPVDDPPDDDVLIGTVSFDGDDVMVAGVYVVPLGVFNPADLNEGDLVMVEGYYLNDTTFNATGFEMIEPAPDNDGGDGDDDAGDADDDVGDADDAGACGDNEHPVLMRLAEEFGESLGVDYDMLVELHCDGNGVGNLVRLLLIAEAAEVDFSVVLEKYLDGMNTNQIARELGVKVKGLGHVTGGKPVGDDDNDDPGNGDNPGNGGDPPGQVEGGNPGHGGTPPGQGGDNPGQGRGNGNANGHNK